MFPHSGGRGPERGRESERKTRNNTEDSMLRWETERERERQITARKRQLKKVQETEREDGGVKDKVMEKCIVSRMKRR